MVLGGVVLLGGAWLIVTAVFARSQLNTARAEVSRLRQQIDARDVVGARATLSQLRDHAGNAHWLTSGPAWAIAADLPGGQPFETARGLAAATDEISSDALPALLSVRSTLSPDGLRAPDGSVRVGPIASSAPALARADAAIDHVVTSVRRLPSNTWVSSVDHARASVLDELGQVAGTIHTADVAAKVLPSMLGQHGTQRYFVGFQNTAEARGTGGLPGAFAILSVTDGKPTFERFESDNALNGVKAGVDLGSQYDTLYGDYDPTDVYINSDVSPNFPDAARIWAGMWQRKTGEHLDGALSVDPTALSYLLAVTGPAALPDGTPIAADSIVSLTQNRLYTTQTDIAKRKALLLDIAKAASEQVLSYHGGSRALLDALATGVRERRVLVWSADPAVEKTLAATPVGGQIPETSAPFVGPVVVNEAGNKLDYYLNRSVKWTRTGCGATRSVSVTVTLTNNAPAGLNAYMTQRNDRPSFPTKPGDSRVYLYYYATSGAQLLDSTLDGKPILASGGLDRGHPVYIADVELPRGATRTLSLRLSEPAGAGSPIVLRQPLVNPIETTVEDQACG